MALPEKLYLALVIFENVLAVPPTESIGHMPMFATREAAEREHPGLKILEFEVNPREAS
jgi:hypothetical protein